MAASTAVAISGSGSGSLSCSLRSSMSRRGTPCTNIVDHSRNSLRGTMASVRSRHSPARSDRPTSCHTISRQSARCLAVFASCRAASASSHRASSTRAVASNSSRKLAESSRSRCRDCARSASRRAWYWLSRKARFSVITTFSCRSWKSRSARRRSCSLRRCSVRSIDSSRWRASMRACVRCCSTRTLRRRRSRSLRAATSSARFWCMRSM
mmetsp:Transcript_1511/g.5895  ORF Transcript_1511/g.5895 Transcript_1511/m.5895 type:complete len:211 (-) Transcript_1511:1141-1773(-)